MMQQFVGHRAGSDLGRPGLEDHPLTAVILSAVLATG
jgi:hypothetical protein